MRSAAATFTLVLATALPMSVHAHVVERSRFTGHAASASWDYQEGDVVTFVNVNLATNTTKDINGKFVDAFAVVSILQTHAVTGDLILAGTAELTPDQFTFTVDGTDNPSRNTPRNTARLVGSGIFQTSEFFFHDIDIDLTWNATGPDESVVTKEKVKDETGFFFKSTVRGASRTATATGSVALEGLGEFTPVPSVSGSLDYLDSGTLVVKTGNDAP